MRSLYLLLTLSILSLFASFTVAEDGKLKFSFGLIGDLPYFKSEEGALQTLIEQMNSENLAFVVHDGDIKNGHEFCTDDLFLKRKKMFEASRAPFIYVPGDNEWTDCHRSDNGNYDPIERLNKLRELFWADDYSLGQTKLKLEQQSSNPKYSDYRENSRWIYGDVLFVGLNIPGSNNNYGRNDLMDQEFYQRSNANSAWLSESFQLAKSKNLAGVMVIIQANPNFNHGMIRRNRDGYRDFRELLLQEVVAFKKPVVLVHGDTHQFRIDQPLYEGKTLEIVKNFTRLETFGSPFINWVKVTVDPNDPKLFQIQIGNRLEND